MNPMAMENIQKYSGVTQEQAFAVNKVNLYERLGRDVFVRLSTNFYNRVYADDDEWFHSIFASKPKEAAIQNQYEFFIQRLGGPPLYSRRKGSPALMGRHMEFEVTNESAKMWLDHMEAAMLETEGIDDESRLLMMNFFKHIAYWLAAGISGFH